MDPLFLRMISLGFALMFALAALHKMSDRDNFLGILKNYEILPSFMLRFSALVIPGVELVLALGWLLMGFLGLQFPLVALASACLLCIYGLAIAVNLFRGRRDIDCGCGLSSSRKAAVFDAGQQTSQSISPLLVWRNLFLGLLTLLALMPATPRNLNALDFVGLVGAVFVAVLFYGALNQLMATNQVIKSWRGHLGRLTNG